MSHQTMNTEQGHWILARMGKRVLRPGGKVLTQKLIDGLNIRTGDTVVEFAPGTGYTADILLSKQPLEYFGIELNEEAADRLKKKINSEKYRIINASASETGLAEGSADKVIGEAMLTMQADHRKSEIIREAYRILKKGGYYGIHELGLTPDTMADDAKREVQQGLARTIKVNARPLTRKEWCTLLENEGFTIKIVEENPMDLLKVYRIIEDEGILRTLKIGFNVLTHPVERKKIFEMRAVFNKFEKDMTSFAIIAEK